MHAVCVSQIIPCLSVTINFSKVLSAVNVLEPELLGHVRKQSSSVWIACWYYRTPVRIPLPPRSVCTSNFRCKFLLTTGTRIIIQFSGLYSCNTRYAYAPPPLAYRPARGRFQHRRVHTYVEHVTYKLYRVMSYRVAYSASFVKWNLDYDFKRTFSLFDDFDVE